MVLHVISPPSAPHRWTYCSFVSGGKAQSVRPFLKCNGNISKEFSLREGMAIVKKTYRNDWLMSHT